MTMVGSLISKVPFFESMESTCLIAMVRHLKSRLYLRNDFVVYQGRRGTEMFFIRSGRGDVIINDKELHQMHAGRYFGEIAMLSRKAKRTATVRAGLNSDLYVLSVDDFREVLTDFPEEAQKVESAFITVIQKYKVKVPVDKSSTATPKVEDSIAKLGAKMDYLLGRVNAIHAEQDNQRRRRVQEKNALRKAERAARLASGGDSDKAATRVLEREERRTRSAARTPSSVTRTSSVTQSMEEIRQTLQ